MQQSLLSASKDRLETKEFITVNVINGDLFTSFLFTVVENFTMDVLLGTAFIEKQYLPFYWRIRM